MSERPPLADGRGRDRRLPTAIVGILTLVMGLLASLVVAGVPAAAEDRWQAKAAQPVQRALDDGGRSDFLVRFDDEADLSRAASITGWKARGEYVVDQLVRTANRSQASARDLLAAEDADFEPFWIANVIYVHGGDSKLAAQLAGLPEVQHLAATPSYDLPKPDPVEQQKRIAAVEWNIANIRADDVWADFDDRGEDIVVANIDTGVDFEHPALVAKYRGTNGDGTFTHDHNWFDPTLVCGNPSRKPCDNIGHGTHVMGTMVGNAGAGNQIGVAPGATWIAAKGCADNARGCPQASMLAAAQWVLAPTDLQGGDPRPDLRPHIVNNSWGAPTGPAADPWFDNALAAWNAAGLFAVFSNGNFGPGCDTAASPADSSLAYGVGAYDVDNVIAGFSSRGPGAGSDIRPAISAPGVAVRSSVPNGGYAAYNGTSMAAPHVSGVVALMWSAAPALLGDVAATRRILDSTARDVEDLTCGGTPEDNNVWGEGRLDAYAALAASPTKTSGTLSGVITDADTGKPLAGVKVSAVSADHQRTTTTRTDGSYHMKLVAGDYQVTFATFGYVDHRADVALDAGASLTHNIALEPAPTTKLSGTVTDGSGHDWPLYATVTVDGTPLPPVHTDPETGKYAVNVPSDRTYTLKVHPLYPGYQPKSVKVSPAGKATTQDVDLTVSPEGCLAPGYVSAERGLFETFDADGLPDGWSVELDVAGRGDGWEFTDPGKRGNHTGGDGNFASIDSAAGQRLEWASLVSPVVDLSKEAEPVVAFRDDYLRTTNGTTVGDVDLSIDGGSTWENIWQQAKSRRGPELVTIPVPQAAGKSDVRVRFHNHKGRSSEGFWEVDDVLVGQRGCDTIDGGLVVGTVTEDLDGKPVVGATVSRAKAEQTSTVTVTTEDDPALTDGFYSLFVPATGRQELLVEHDVAQFGERRHTVDVVADDTVRADLTLGVGRLSMSAESLDTNVKLGKSRTVTVKVTNVGTAPASYDFVERPTGTTAPLKTLTPNAPKRQVPTIDTGGPFTPTDVASTGGGGTQEASDAWQILPNMNAPNSSGLAIVGDGKLYHLGGEYDDTTPGQPQRVYDIASRQWSGIARTEDAFNKAAGGFIDHKVYVVGGWESKGGESNATRIYDPRTDTWSRGANAPVRVAAAGYATANGKLYVIGGRAAENPGFGSRTVSVYDPRTDSWTQAADYPTPVAWQACDTIDGLIYCASGQAGGEEQLRNTYAYDPKTDRWYRVADTPYPVWGAAFAAQGGRLLMSGGVTDGFTHNQGLAYDPATDRWEALPNSKYIVRRASGACGFYKVGGHHPSQFLEDPGGNMPWLEQLTGAGECGSPANQVDWLKVSGGSGTLKPGETARVRVTLDAARSGAQQPTVKEAVLLVHEDTRFAATQMRVRMEIEPPHNWGRIYGTVTGPQQCGAPSQPIAGVNVLIHGQHEAVVVTGPTGGYSYWLPPGKTTVTARRPGWHQESDTVNVLPSRSVRADLRLQLNHSC
ncbi:S8 family serine peptidase [Streptomyces sp. NPDC056512]|uniref:S8 family serine peptidase n=1 Tax=Streptomyces sp. NPDC056512 TaxID=3345846 RepID=UPI0036CFD577